MTQSRRFGLYFYSWYSRHKWAEHRVRHTPQIGWYESSRESAIAWQVQSIARTSVDYVVLEMVSSKDWCFDQTVATVNKLVPMLLGHGIGYTFLFDVWVDNDQSQVDSFHDMLDTIQDNGWLEACTKDASGKPLLFVFNPDCLSAKRIADSFRDIRVNFPAWVPTWGSFSDLRHMLVERGAPTHFDALFAEHRDESRNIYEVLQDLGYCQFWQRTDDTLNMNGFATVVPGYDDLLMSRKPQMAAIVERYDGQTLAEQFSCAVQSGAQDILIYGWNEYFEATTIEPTLEYGDFYVELTRRLIEQAKGGEPIHFPNDMGKPQPAVPVYLTPALERAAQRHGDGVPRWDQDDYVARIEVPKPAVLERGHAVFRDISVTNMGLKPWRIETKREPIRLGVRLYDNSGSVMREGRTDLGRVDIADGTNVRVDLQVEIVGLPSGEYTAEIDAVWEGKYWFDSATTLKLSLVV